MPFSDAYLRSIVTSQVVGDFPPFTSRSTSKTDNYIRKIVARLSSSAALRAEADFSSYGSGFASYVEVHLFKRDRSDTTVQIHNKRTTYETNGLLLYISRLTPYWFYGADSWVKNQEDQPASSGLHLTPDSQAGINQWLWEHDRQLTETVLQEFRYGLLTPEELRQPAPEGIYIPTVLAKKPYTVFDCSFYWQD